MSIETAALFTAITTMFVFSAIGVAYARRRRITVESYISARGSIGGSAAMATITASMMGAWILFGPAEAATWAGLIAIIGYAVGQALPILAFVVIGPRMRQLMPNGHSLTEFIWFRYGRAMYAFSLLIIVFYMFTFLAAEMGAIARAVGFITDAPLLLTLCLVGAATLAYTIYGGLRASIFTDNIQFLIIYPLMLFILIVSILELGGWSAALGTISKQAPNLLSPTYQPGIELGITLMIAILAANLFHQGLWQRVYACQTDADVRKGFLLGGLLVIPLILSAGLFGLWSVGQGLSGAFDPIALFRLAVASLPSSVIIALMVLALVLVMSSMDTLLNGIASVFTSDIPRLKPQILPGKLLTVSRIITITFIVPAIIVGYMFDSVLYLFFIADLVCAGAMVPVFMGMFVRRFDGRSAMTSSIIGITAGALFFPTKNLAGWWEWTWLTETWHILSSGNTLASFLSAVVVSSIVAGIFIIAKHIQGTSLSYNFENLKTDVQLIDE
jgi:Na+/proline symporter